MTDYKPGDRVRVTFESAITEVTDNGFLVVVDPDRDHHYVAPDQGWTVEKITPDYKAQIEALEPGTAFVLTLGDATITVLRVNAGDVVTTAGAKFTVGRFLDFLGPISDLRILK